MIATLQSLRFVFVMMIFMSHFAYGGIPAFDAGGDCGVAFFLLLSGFVLSMGYGWRIDSGAFSYRRFLLRRLTKLYPLHLLCLSFYLVVVRPTIDLRVVLNALLLQCWVPSSDYYFSCNSVSWFLSVMLFCYLIFPWLYRHASLRLLAVVLTSYIVVYLLVPTNGVNAILYVNPLVRSVDFLLGIMLFKMCGQNMKITPPKWIDYLLVVMLIAALAAYPFVGAKLRNAPIFWPVLLPLIWAVACGNGPLSTLLRAHPFVWLGSLSMSLFMTHQMLIGILLHRLPPMPAALTLSVCITTVIIVSWVIDRFVLRAIGRWLDVSQ